MLTHLYALVLYCLVFGESRTQIYAPSSAEHTNRPAMVPTIYWDQQTRVRVSHERFNNAGYARLVELWDGSLLCAYEADGSVVATRSADAGATWQDPVIVAPAEPGINMATPDIVQLQDDSILVCYNPRPHPKIPDHHFAIETRKSYDGGVTWKDRRILFEAGTEFTLGCWEPVAIQLPAGEIQLFFADESTFGDAFDQQICMLSSTDSGLTWTTQPEVISHMPHGRDGMPSPLLLANGREIVCAIEQTVGDKNLQPAILRTTADRNWKGTIGGKSPNREQPLTEPLPIETYAGAPYLRQLSTGETILSYQGTEGRINKLHNAEMKVLIGDDQARNFAGKTVPFDIPPEKFALWNSISVLKGDSIIALTSTNAYSQKGEIWMVKGRLSNP